MDYDVGALDSGECWQLEFRRVYPPDMEGSFRGGGRDSAVCRCPTVRRGGGTVVGGRLAVNEVGDGDVEVVEFRGRRRHDGWR